MPIHQVLILAIIQGFTEFLPISSSAHLALAPWLLGWKDQGLTFDIALHLGTLAAVLMYFWKDWLQIAAQAFGINYRPDEHLARNSGMLWLLAVASLPIGLFGYLFKEQAETSLRNPFLMGGMLIVVGILIAVVERAGRHLRRIEDVDLTDALVIGAAQALAIVPGTSRSGITIAAGLGRQLDRTSAARFSFLLSTPAIVAAAAKALLDLRKHGGLESGMTMPFVLGILVSAITGCFVISFFLKFLKKRTLTFFVYYRVIFGIIVIALAIFRGYAG